VISFHDENAGADVLCRKQFDCEVRSAGVRRVIEESTYLATTSAGAEGLLDPYWFVAITATEYEIPEVRPVMVQVRAGPVSTVACVEQLNLPALPVAVAV